MEEKKSPETSRSNVLKSLAWAVVRTIAIIASALAFPSWMPMMIAVWLVVYSVLVWRKERSWIVPLVVIGILFVKRLDWPLGLVLLGVGMMLVAVLEIAWKRWPHRAGIILLWTLWFAMAIQWRAIYHTRKPPASRAGRPIVCLGDSLTATGYPRDLAEKVRVPVLDPGSGAMTTEEALPLLPSVIAANPQVLVLELGGHDFIRGRPRSEVKQNLEKFIGAMRSIGCEVILFEIPRGFIIDPYAGLEREIAREQGLELISDGAIRNLVIRSSTSPIRGLFPHVLSDDGLHPNLAGREWLAKHVFSALRRVCGDSIAIQ